MAKVAQDIILRPIITERSMAGVAMRKYTFEVARGAGKIEIGKAVEELFPGNTVEKVNTMHVRGKLKRMGRHEGMTRQWKKAIITIKSDSKKIEFFESLT